MKLKNHIKVTCQILFRSLISDLFRQPAEAEETCSRGRETVHAMDQPGAPLLD